MVDRGAAAVTDEADRLATPHAGAELRAEARLVAVAGRDLHVADAGVVPVALGRLAQHGATRARGPDRRALRDRDVDALVDVAGALLVEAAGDRAVDGPPER